VTSSRKLRPLLRKLQQKESTELDIVEKRIPRITKVYRTFPRIFTRP